MDKHHDMKNGVRVQVDKLNLEMIEQDPKEIAGRNKED
jgi:hypothetical protein